MARFYLRNPLNNYASELEVRAALARLDDSWRVFHSVAWQSERYGRQGDGEADFVLLHPQRGLLVLDVKGGERIEVEDGDSGPQTVGRSHHRQELTAQSEPSLV